MMTDLYVAEVGFEGVRATAWPCDDKYLFHVQQHGILLGRLEVHAVLLKQAPALHICVLVGTLFVVVHFQTLC